MGLRTTRAAKVRRLAHARLGPAQQYAQSSRNWRLASFLAEDAPVMCVGRSHGPVGILYTVCRSDTILKQEERNRFLIFIAKNFWHEACTRLSGRSRCPRGRILRSARRPVFRLWRLAGCLGGYVVKTRNFGIAVIFCVAASAAWAMPITNTVVIGDKEWARATQLFSITWNQLNAVCSNIVCDGTDELYGFNLTGWSWATSSQVEDLIAAIESDPNLSLIPNSCVDESDAFAGFGLSTCRVDQGTITAASLSGWTRSTETLDSGEVRYVEYSLEFERNAEIGERIVGGPISREDPDRGILGGAWLFRTDPTPVPAPATLPLLGMALLILMTVRKLRRRLD